MSDRHNFSGKYQVNSVSTLESSLGAIPSSGDTWAMSCFVKFRIVLLVFSFEHIE